MVAVTINVAHAGVLTSQLPASPGVADRQVVQCVGGTAVGDGAQGSFEWRAGDITPANNGTVHAATGGRWHVRRQDPDVVDARLFGASPSASAAVNTAAIQAAIDADVGDWIYLPGKYKINAKIVCPSGRHIRFVGSGLERNMSDTFGSAVWDEDGDVWTNSYGTVIHQLSTTADAFGFASGQVGKISFYDMMIVGPGSGTTTGVRCGGGAEANNVVWFYRTQISNFYRGWDSLYCITAHGSTDLYLRGNATGWLARGVADVSIYGMVLEANTVAAQFGDPTDPNGGVQNLKLYSFLVQNNTTGFMFSSENNGSTVEEVVFSGGWFEANTGYDIDSTTSAGTTYAQQISFEGCRFNRDVRISGVNWVFRVCRSFGDLLCAGVGGLSLDRSAFSDVRHDAGDGPFAATDSRDFDFSTKRQYATVSGTDVAIDLGPQDTRLYIPPGSHTGTATITMPTFAPDGRRVVVYVAQSSGGGAIAWSGVTSFRGYDDVTTPGAPGQVAILTFEAFLNQWHCSGSSGWT